MQFDPLLLVPCGILLLSGISGLAYKFGKFQQAGLEHFAGGVVLSAVCTELMPMLTAKDASGEKPSIVAISVGFCLGVALLLTIRALFPEGDDEDEEADGYKAVEGAGGEIPMSNIVAIGVDLLIDGGLMGMSFAAGAGAGLIMMISVALEMASVGSTTLISMTAKGVSKGKAMAVICGLATTILVGGLAGLNVLAALKGTDIYFGALAFGVAACLWLVVEDLLAEAHEKTGAAEPKWITAAFFVGFLVPVILDRFSGE